MPDYMTLMWIYTMHNCVQVHNSMMEFTENQHKTSSQQAEIGNSRIKCDNDSLEKVKSWL